MSVVVLQGARVICPTHGVDAEVNVAIEDGVIAAVGKDAPSGARLVDVRGRFIVPGLVDLCAHIRDPGEPDDEDAATTLGEALAGGVTTLVAMPDTDPCTGDGPTVVHRLATAARARPGRAAPDVVVAGCLTRDAQGQEPAPHAEMVRAGARVFTDAAPVASALVMRRSLEYARGAAARVVIARGPQRDLADGAVVVESALSTRLGLRGVPEAACEIAAVRDVRLAELAHMRLHVDGLFSVGGANAAREAAARGALVTASVHAATLLLDEEEPRRRPYDTTLRVWPPLPTAKTRQALLALVESGALCVASGHAPRPRRHKDVEFAVAEPGAPWLSTLLPLLWGALTPAAFVRATAAGPAAVLGFGNRGHLGVGARADLVVVGTDARAIENPLHPLHGVTPAARVHLTVVGGRAGAGDDVILNSFSGSEVNHG